MKKNCLIVNTGSASKKYSFYQGDDKEYSAHFEKEGDVIVVREKTGDQEEKKEVLESEYPKASAFVIESLIKKQLIEKQEDLQAIGIRIVAPGNYFLETKIIDDEYIKKAELTLEKVPLHLGPALEEIKNIKKKDKKN